MQHAIDAKSDDGDVATRLYVDVGGALVERVLPEPVNQCDNMMVVCIKRASGLSEFNQLLEIVDPADATICLFSTFDGACEVIKLADVARDILGARDHHFDIEFQHVAQLALPGGHKWLACRNDYISATNFHRQNVSTGSVIRRHHISHSAHVDLQRIDVVIRQFNASGHPFGQALDIEVA